MERVLVTGANGLLGRNLASQLALRGMDVTGVFRVPPTQVPSAWRNIIHVDFSSDWQEADLPCSIDAIIHLAQSSHFRNFPDRAVDVFRVNVESTARLLDYAKRVGATKFIYASSGGVYGNGARAFKENAAIVPAGQLGYYLGSKACGEILVQSYASVFQVLVVRPFFIYGPGQNREMLIPRLFDSVSTGKPITLQGHNGIRINPIHVQDASAALAAALSISDSATFNIAGPDVLSIREICETVGRYIGREPIFEHRPEAPKDLIADISAMKEKLFHPNRHFMDSLAEISTGPD